MRDRLVIAVALAAVTLLVYWPVGTCGFISFDDPTYVTNNPHVLEGVSREGVWWAFTATYAGNWHPLTWLSHMLDGQLYGIDPRGHHFSSLAIHTANVLLLFLLLTRMTGAVGRSGFVAALFALHPLHVESVAWVAERKDVLSAFFWFLTMLLYAGYVAKPGIARYLSVVLAFAAGLMAKPMLVTLPCVLLLMDYWPLGRFRRGAGRESSIRRAVLEKIPLFALAAVSSGITLYAQQQGEAVMSLERMPVTFRIVNALVGWVSYIGKMCWPHDQAIIYPLDPAMPAWWGIAAGVGLTAVTFLAWRDAERRPYLIVGWLWFIGTLVPVIGLVQVGSQALADRYSYIPFVGLFIMAAYGVPDLVERWRLPRHVLTGGAFIILAVCALATRHQLGYWRDSYTLFRHAVSVTGDNYLAQNELGVALAKQGNYDEAFLHFQESIRISPTYVNPYYNWGVALMELGRPGEAIGLLGEAVRLKPDFIGAYNNLGVALFKTGRVDEAIRSFSEALRLDPGNANARENLATCLQMRGTALPGR